MQQETPSVSVNSHRWTSSFANSPMPSMKGRRYTPCVLTKGFGKAIQLVALTAGEYVDRTDEANRPIPAHLLQSVDGRR